MLCWEHTSIINTTFVILALLLYLYLFYFICTTTFSVEGKFCPGPLEDCSAESAGPPSAAHCAQLHGTKPGDSTLSHDGKQKQSSQEKEWTYRADQRTCEVQCETISSFESNLSRKHE